MAIIVSDNFNRANDPTALGTATTGQVWSQVLGVAGSFGISANSALWTWNIGDPGTSRVVIESGFTDAITKVTLVDPTINTGNFGIGVGILFRYVDANYYWKLVYYRFPGPSNHLRLQRTYAGITTTVVDVSITLSANDTISVGYCGTTFEIFVNGVSRGTWDDSAFPQNYGTMCGLTATSGTYFSTILKHFDDFLVSTNGTCTPTYNCTGGACVDPGDGSGTYPTLAACLASCVVPVSYNCTPTGCVDPGDGSGTYATLEECVAVCVTPISYNCVGGVCVDPGDGSGEFTTLLECQNSGCGTIPIVTCSPAEAADNPLPRVQRVLDFTQEIHRNLQLQISAESPLTLYGYSMEWVPVSISELTNQRNAYAASWVFAEWGHLFEAYVAYISTAPITWNITVDGNAPDSYTLPSSAGAFVKQWVVLKAKKGKLFSWSFSCAEEMQIITSQCLLLAKEFKTQGAYQQLQPFGDSTYGGQ